MLTHHNILNNGYCVGERLRSHAMTGFAFRCHFIIASHGHRKPWMCDTWCDNGSSRTAFQSAANPRSGWRRNVARRFMECQRCSSLNWTIPVSRIRISRHYGPVSWRERLPGGGNERVISEMHCREITIACGMTETSPGLQHDRDR